MKPSRVTNKFLKLSLSLLACLLMVSVQLGLSNLLASLVHGNKAL
jgi:hypothetical protein